jgi:hypothetical protein
MTVLKGVQEVSFVQENKEVFYMIFLTLPFFLFFIINCSLVIDAQDGVEFVCLTNITDICSDPKPASDIEFLSDDTNVIVAGTYKALWNVIDGDWEYIGLQESAAISLDKTNRRLASSVSDVNVRIYDLSVNPPRQDEVVRDTEDSMSPTFDVVFGRDSSMVFTSGLTTIYKWAFDGYRWRLVDEESLFEPTSQKAIWALFYDYQRDLLVTLTNNGDCYVMDSALSLISAWNNTILSPPDQSFAPPYYTSFCLLNNWTVLWCNGSVHQYILLNLSTGEYSSIPMQLGPFNHIYQSHNGEWLALVDQGKVAIYNSSTFKRLTWFLCSAYVTGIAWSQDDRYIATTDERETLQIWVNILDPEFNHPPNVEILSHENGETVANTVRIAGNATDDRQILSVLFKIDDGDWQFADGSIEWQFLWDTRFVINGTHRISVRSFDGEKFSSIAQVSLYIDNNYSTRIPPTIAIDEPLNNSIVFGAVSIKGRAWGQNPIQIIRLSYSTYNIDLEVSNGNWSTIIDTLGLPNGFLEMSATAFDGLWYSNPKTVVLTVRNNGTTVNRPPFVRIHEPESGEICSLYIVVKGSAADEERRLRFVLVRVDDGPWQSTTYEDDWPYEWTYGIDTWQLENGEHHISAVCADDIQFSEMVMVPFTVSNDLDHPFGRPNINVLTPTNGSIISGKLVVAGTADSELLINKINYSVNGDGPFTAEGKTNWTFVLNTMELTNGPCELKIWVSGNVKDSTKVVLSLEVLNNRPPICIITWPVNNQTFIDNFEIRGTAADSEGEIPLVEVQLDGSKWQRCDGNLTWSFHWETENVSSGNHIVRARSFDGTLYSEIQEIAVLIYHPTGPVIPTSKVPYFSWIQVLIIIIVISVVIFLVYRYRKIL